MDSQDSLVDVLAILWKWRKKIIGITVIAGILSIVLSLTLSNYYQSTTIFFAASTDMNKPEQVFGLTNKASKYYGDDFDNDRLLTVASSPVIISHLIDSFHIAEHYKMKTDTPKRKYKLEKKFRSNYEILKTKFDAISLSFEDKDPEFAAKVVNEARKQVNRISLSLLKESQKKRMATYERSIREKTIELNAIGDSLQKTRQKYNIFDLSSQGELLTKIAATTESSLAETKASLENAIRSHSPKDTIRVLKIKLAGLESKLNSVLGNSNSSQFSIKSLREGMATTQSLEDGYENLSDQLDLEKEKLRQLKTVFQSNSPTIILAEKGEVPKIKSRPKRSILVIAATLAALIFSILGALLFENLQKLDLKKIKGA